MHVNLSRPFRKHCKESPVSESKWHVGQNVMLVENCRGPVEAPVTRVARKYVYVTQWGRERRFNIETGRGDNQCGYGDIIYTLEDWSERQRRGALIKDIRQAGLYFQSGDSSYSTATLQRLWDALQVEESGRE
ncbi:beta barrel domain-containing protein [Mycobacteroides immunogenum]